MPETHHQFFYGQNTGLILNSFSKSEPYILFKCIKKKPNGDWEKPSNSEGKVIKCSLDEIVMILEVLNRKILSWTIQHSYKDNKTPISFNWENNDAKNLWINIANYSKMLNFAQTEILKILLTHILKEKIKYATSSNKGELYAISLENNLDIDLNNDNNAKIISPAGNPSQDKYEKVNNNQYNETKNISIASISKKKKKNNISHINGKIKGETAKALLITFDSGQEIWIPKSTIHCQYTPQKHHIQDFLIDNWILNRNKITAQH